MKNQRYVFQSIWNIAATRLKVWQVMTATPFSWDSWWPELQDLHDIQATSELTGTSFRCTWRAPLGYKLNCHIVITECLPLTHVKLQVEGDLWGEVVCALTESNGHTVVNVDWRVQTTKAWMNRLAPFLKPLFTWGHHAVMRSGERGLRKYVKHI